jgi:tetratricopeptide (TPR) repeat protein
LGSSYFTIEDYDNALTNYKKVLELDNENAPALAFIGSYYRNKGDYQQALHYYNLSLSINPDYAYAYDGIGTAYYFTHDYENSIKYLTKAYKMDPTLRYTATFLADSYLQQEDYDSVLKLANDKLRYNTDNYDMHSYLGFAYFMKNEVEPAIFFYKKAINLTPSTNLNRLAYNNAGLGFSYLRNKEYNQAIKHFEKSLGYKKIPIAYGGLSAAYYFIGDIEKSDQNFKIMSFENALERDKPITSNDVHALALIYWDHKAYDKTIQHYEIAINLNPNNFVLYHELGKVYLEIGNNKKAIENFKKSLDLNKNNTEAQKILLQITT